MQLLSIEGAPRSGTTLLQQVINSHPHAVCTHEFGLDRLLRILDMLFDAEREQQRQLAVLESWPDELKDRWFTEGADRQGKQFIDDRFLVPRRWRDFQPLLEAHFAAISNKRRIKVAGDKLPNVRNRTIWEIRENGWRVKSIHIVRHPIGVIESSLTRSSNTERGDDTWHITTLDKAIDEWIANWDKTAIRAAERHKDDLFVRYEDLCDEFSAEATRIAKHLGIGALFKNIVEPGRDRGSPRTLTRAEIDHVHARVGDWLHGWRDRSLADLLRAHPGIAGPSASVNDILTIDDGTLRPEMLVRGFAEPEPPTGVWTNAGIAQVRYRLKDLPADGRVKVSLQFYPFNNGSGQYRYGVKFLGGKRKILAGSIGPVAAPVTRSFHCKLQDGYVDFTLFIPNPKSADQEPLGDTRRLGLKIKSITHRPLPPI